MAEEYIRGGICHAIHRYAKKKKKKIKNKYIKNYDNIKNHNIFRI